MHGVDFGQMSPQRSSGAHLDAADGVDVRRDLRKEQQGMFSGSGRSPWAAVARVTGMLVVALASKAQAEHRCREPKLTPRQQHPRG